MRIRGDSAVDDVAKELSNRFKQYRIACQITQEELADKSMVSLSTIKRFENGEDIGLSKLIRLMESLDLIGNFEILIPDQSNRPSYYLDRTKPRQRARKKTVKKSDWKWGDE
ncbi:MAG: helix-turn-helix domain-containing protein [Candidatus Methanomethylophilaceae archaeon]|nr:helix-turn-helix domain-containing protein [Candidatus Methanomethylophilaceae archaeon]